MSVSDNLDIFGVRPDGLYPFSEAARLIPSPRRGKRTHVNTLHRWRLSGRLTAVERRSGMHRYWFVPGWELLRLCRVEAPVRVVSPAERRRAHERDVAYLKAAGF